MAEINAAAAAFGLVVAAPPATACEVWPEHWAPLMVFVDVCSQWRMGPSGPTGLDYRVLPPAYRTGMGGRRGRRAFEYLQVMEAEALRWFASRRARG